MDKNLGDTSIVDNCVGLILSWATPKRIAGQQRDPDSQGQRFFLALIRL
jgi:hypothetical protein